MPHQHEALLIESSQSHCPVTSAIRADPAFCSAFESRGALHHPRLVLPWLHWGSTFWTSSVCGGGDSRGLGLLSERALLCSFISCLTEQCFLCLSSSFLLPPFSFLSLIFLALFLGVHHGGWGDG